MQEQIKSESKSNEFIANIYSEGSEELESSLKNYVDSQLKDKSLIVFTSPPKPRTSKDLMAIIKSHKDKGRSLWLDKTEKDYRSIIRELGEIEIGNKRIEQKVKIELMGFDKNPVKKISYYAYSFITSLMGKNERAQDILKKQLERVNSVAQGLEQASNVMNLRLIKLEEYYDSLTLRLKQEVEYRKELIDKINKLQKLLEDTSRVFEDSEDFNDKLKYCSAARKIRKKLLEQAEKLKLVDKNILDIKNELPFIDSFGDFCQAYSFALQESCQKVQSVKRHISNVMSLYFEIMRTDHINQALKQRINKLFEYTRNMNDSLSKARDLILEVDRNKVFEEEYQRRYNSLEEMVDDIFNSNSRTFNELEISVSSLLSLNPSESFQEISSGISSEYYETQKNMLEVDKSERRKKK